MEGKRKSSQRHLIYKNLFYFTNSFMGQELEWKFLEDNGRKQLHIYHLCFSRLKIKPEM